MSCWGWEMVCMFVTLFLGHTFHTASDCITGPLGAMGEEVPATYPGMSGSG